MSLLKEKYQKEVIPEMKNRFSYSNVMAVPCIQKVVVNVGTGRFAREKGNDEEVVKYITTITGQKPIACTARKSIASFKTRIGQVIGYKVTLRRDRMYDFLSRFIYASVPRMRDFRGFDVRAVDTGGNLTMGVKEHIIFPETIGEDVRTIFGLEVTVVSNAKTREEAIPLFRLIGFPLKKM